MQLEIFTEFQKASFNPNEKMLWFFGIRPSDSKNYYGFIVDDFSKFVDTTNLQGFAFIRLPVTVSNRLNAGSY